MAAKKSYTFYRRLEDHPKHAECMRYSAQNRIHAALVFQAYLDATEVKNWMDVRIHHDTERKFSYLSAKESPAAQQELIFPLTSRETISMQRIKELFSTLPDPAGRAEHPALLTFAIFDSDSTSVYYRVYNGIRPPPEKLILAGKDDAVDGNE
eukprot:m.175225 g.175225  ORF g.175225 m.175225 type:complete len:153 (-) comp21350_c2_seq2:22-480(-)